jgi:hypothetical protein
LAKHLAPLPIPLGVRVPRSLEISSSTVSFWLKLAATKFSVDGTTPGGNLSAVPAMYDAVSIMQ